MFGTIVPVTCSKPMQPNDLLVLFHGEQDVSVQEDETDFDSLAHLDDNDEEKADDRTETIAYANRNNSN